jgi:hypothetical protein
MVMVLLLNLATTSIWGTRQGSERLAAENRAMAVLESYRSRGFSSYRAGQTVHFDPSRENGSLFTTSLRIEAVPGFDTAELRHLTATVTWSSQRGPQKVAMDLYANPLLP